MAYSWPAVFGGHLVLPSRIFYEDVASSFARLLTHERADEEACALCSGPSAFRSAVCRDFTKEGDAFAWQVRVCVVVDSASVCRVL